MSQSHGGNRGPSPIEAVSLVRVMIAVAAVVLAALVATVRVVDAIDLQREWLSVRSVFDGISLLTPTDDLADRYGVVFKGDRGGLVDPGTPAQLLLDLPLLVIPYDALPVAAVVWTLASGVFAAWALARVGQVPFSRVVVGLPLVLIAPSGVQQLLHGQSMFLVVGLVGWSWHAVRRADGWSSGWGLGAAVALKPFLLPMVAVAFLSRRRAAFGSIAGGAVLSLAGVVSLGLDVDELWGWIVVAGTEMADSRWNLALLPVVPHLVLAGVVGLGLWLVAARRELDVSFSVGIVMALAVAPLVWPMYVLVLLVPLAALGSWWLAGALLGFEIVLGRSSGSVLIWLGGTLAAALMRHYRTARLEDVPLERIKASGRSLRRIRWRRRAAESFQTSILLRRRGSW